MANAPAETCPTASGPPPARTLSKSSIAVAPHLGHGRPDFMIIEAAVRKKKLGWAFPTWISGLLLQSVRELLAEFRDFRRDDGATISCGRILAEVILVVLLPAIERGERSHLRHDGSSPDPGFLDFLDDMPRRLLLLRGAGEDRGAVLRPLVRSLSILGGRLVDREEDPQDIHQGDRLWIEGDLHGLRMARCVRADGLVRRIREMTARVSHLDLLDPAEVLVNGL